jgi:Flp pilus assembly secretin CpaC
MIIEDRTMTAQRNFRQGNIKTRDFWRMASVRPVVLGLMATFVIGAAPQANAQSQITVEKDQSLRISLKAPAGNIIVANPRIADVTVVDSRTLYIIGRGVGTSGITITDASGRTLWDASVLVSLTRANAVTLYRGTQSVINVCMNTCVEVTSGVSGTTPTP